MVDLSDLKLIKALCIGFESWTALSQVEQLFVFALCNCVWMKSATSNLVKLGSSPQGLCALSWQLWLGCVALTKDSGEMKRSRETETEAAKGGQRSRGRSGPSGDS